MGGEGRVKEKRVGKETKNQTTPFPLFLTPKSFSNQTWEWRRVYVGGRRDVKATDFLTSLAALAPHLGSLHLGSQGWGQGGVGKG